MYKRLWKPLRRLLNRLKPEPPGDPHAYVGATVPRGPRPRTDAVRLKEPE